MAKILTFDHPEFDAVSQKEWLVTNGIGGYASSTICGANTRRYHGLLVASFHPPTDRRVLISKVEERVILADDVFNISSNAYPGVIYPQGFQYITSFQRAPFPQTVFSIKEASISKTVFMRHGHNTTVIIYKNQGTDPLRMEILPLCVYRDYHQLFREEPGWKFEMTRVEEGLYEIKPGNDVPAFHMRFTTGEFIPKSDWYRNFEYEWEKDRGLDFREDAKCLGTLVCDLNPGDTFFLIFGTAQDELKGDPEEWMKEEANRLDSLRLKGGSKFVQNLTIAGDQFLVRRASTGGFTLLAGYHWFTDWGRDTMIAMRGLVIATGKQEVAKSILRTFLQYVDEGMIPNRFPDQGEQPEYNTMDATLWMFVAMYEYYERFRDLDFIQEHFDLLTSVLEAHFTGTRYGIQVLPEGLLYGGKEGVQLTWMDAKVDGHVVTPRIGCPVEINALWYNALIIYVKLGKAVKASISAYEERAKDLRRVFRKYYFNAGGYLHDVVIPGGAADDTIRPNQVYAVSLPFSPLTKKEARSVMRVIKEHLYTDYGLRSLSRFHPDFKSVYTGDQWHRDHAYHQGTIWGFLWGEYAMAHLRIHQHSPKSRRWVRNHAKKLRSHFYQEDGLWAMSEIFDGGEPAQGKGCIHQAWTTGMTLLALLNVKK